MPSRPEDQAPMPESTEFNPAESVAAFGQGLGQGALTDGGYNVASQALGGATPESIQGLNEMHPKASGMGHFIGSTVRDLAAMAAVGPMALFVNAAVNTAGEAADLAYNHDPRLTREHVMKTAMTETLGAAAGIAGGAALNAAGRVGSSLVKSAVGRAGEMLAKGSARMGVEAAGALDDVAEVAIRTGVFTRGRAAALKAAKDGQKAVGDSMSQLMDMADHVGVGRPPVPGTYTATLAAAKEAVQGLRFGKNQAVVEGADRILADITNKPPTPSEMGQLEKKIGDLMGQAGAEDGHAMGTLSIFKNKIKDATNTVLQGLGINPAAYRNLQTQYSAHKLLEDSVPKTGFKEIGKAIGKGAGILALEQGAEAVGVDPKYAKTGAAIALGASLKGSGLLKATLGARTAIKGAANAGQYTLGQGLSEIDRSSFALFMAQQLHSSAADAAATVAAGTVKNAVLPSLDGLVEAVMNHAQNPEFGSRKNYDRLAKSPLPANFQDTGVNDHDMAMHALQTQLPARLTMTNPAAPPVSRTLNATESLKLRRYAHGMMDPIGVLKSPHPEGLSAVRQHYPATYEAFTQELLQRVGVNAPAGHPARRVMEQLGLDQSLTHAGLIAQLVHGINPAPPPGDRSHKGATGSGSPGIGSKAQTSGDAESSYEP
jgi:hypothetical protein